MSSTLIKNALIVTMNPDRQILRGSLLVENDRITAIDSSSHAADRVIDAQGQVVIPGLIQTHVHLCQTLFRGLADDMLLMDWLQTRIWPLEAAHDPASIYYSALLGIGELFRGGTTAIIDMETVHHTECAFQAIVDAGIRAMSGKCMMNCGPAGVGNLLEQTSTSLQQSVDLLEKWHGAGEGRLLYAFSPRFAVSCSEEMLIQVRNLARHYNVAVHTHASENQDEIAIVQAERGMRNVVYFDHLGMTGTNLILAHCIWLDSTEIEILRRSGTRVVHCPSSNLKLGSGIASIPQMLEQGVHVSIGADGAPCNNNLDQFMEMRTAALIQKPLHGPTAMPAWQTFELATLGGAVAMGLEQQIGSLEVGKKADLAMINLNNLHCAPVDDTNIYSQLIYQARSSDVTLTMVDGQIVYENGRLTSIDETNLMKQCSEAIQRVRRRAGI
ncbi:5'-deoxyadenosine deaminase [Desulfoscipio gibsoniae]|uniref:Cytosine deaminase-like metal-dependent hydrolase n=1 Tax=Desulfoscipio gibsoniae DSM 7213 TaxID=767817 RepID=R4KG38_9FIRM|nr:5'-deoxyadenosine deaminase [Desulfoscipio gibsoniae]AGL01544.1 cytosine deaminase-like metal-dependent hydrolase [Desulfoscipio gibsoniae DSM 7213]